MHFLSGRCSFLPDGGAPIPIAPGDTLNFPASTFGLWTVTETVRKVYVIL